VAEALVVPEEEVMVNVEPPLVMSMPRESRAWTSTDWLAPAVKVTALEVGWMITVFVRSIGKTVEVTVAVHGLPESAAPPKETEIVAAVADAGTEKETVAAPKPVAVPEEEEEAAAAAAMVPLTVLVEIPTVNTTCAAKRANEAELSDERLLLNESRIWSAKDAVVPDTICESVEPTAVEVAATGDPATTEVANGLPETGKPPMLTATRHAPRRVGV